MTKLIRNDALRSCYYHAHAFVTVHKQITRMYVEFFNNLVCGYNLLIYENYVKYKII